MRRGRRDPDRLVVGDALDFWRVRAIEPWRPLRLRAEMRLPGEASLEWMVEPVDDGRRARLRQLATFVPRGLWGRVYWYSVAVFHRFVFPAMIDGLADEAGRRSTARDRPGQWSDDRYPNVSKSSA